MTTQSIFEVGDHGSERLLAAEGEAVALCQQIYDETYDVVHADDMLRYFPGRPELHRTTSLYRAMLAAGAVDVTEQRG